jgi:hypothetical protein
VTEEFELAPGELLIMEAVCRTSDELAKLEKLAAEVLEAGEPFRENNAGAHRPHPVFEEVRRHRVLLERHAATLKLPHLAVDSGTKTAHKPASLASVRARKAAQARWKKGRETPSAG